METNENTENEETGGLGECPKCGGPIRETKHAFGCQNWKELGCKFAIWKTISNREIDEAIAIDLLENGKTSKLDGFVSKAGNEFSANLKLVDGKVKFEFSDS